jgi:riboflavin kinase/FMN adenylyltransferase
MRCHVWKGSPVRVVVIGVFDGVHRGHQVLVDRAVRRSLEWGKSGAREVIAVTFDPHPAAVLRPEHAPLLLTRIDRRRELLRAAGADDVAVLHFDREFSQLTPTEFVDRLMGDILGHREIDAIVAGSNFRFGRGAVADVAALRKIGLARGFEVDEVALVTERFPDAADVVWSSTFVRSSIASGDVSGAARVLGRWHRVDGVVVGGERRGRQLGYPTANVDTGSGFAIPRDGVYAGWLIDGADRWPAAISVGTNPQFDGSGRTVEAYVLGRDDLDLYGDEVGVEFAEFIRGQQVFDSVDGLIVQMAEDVDRAASITAEEAG